MQAFERQLPCLTEAFQPSVRRVRVHRFTVPLDEQSVRVLPLISAVDHLLMLFKLIELQEPDGICGDFQYAAAALGLGRTGVGAGAVVSVI